MPKSIIILVISLGIIVYVGFNIWFFYYKGNAGKTSIPPFLNNTNSSNQPPNPANTSQAPFIPATTQSPMATSTPTPTPIPTPTPLQGPGRYACDPNGTCKDYSDEMRKFCAVTFADRNCLNQCENPVKRCTQ